MKTSRMAAAAVGLTSVALLASGCGLFGDTQTVTVTSGTTPTAPAATTTAPAATTTTPAATTATTAATTATAAPAESPVVKANKALQNDLTALGFYDGPINGVYGPATTRAVTVFQRRADLPADGIAGPQTHAAMNLALGNDTTDAVDLLQTALTGLCYYRGSVDGVFGSGTEAALRAFQKAEGINVDGRYGPGTATALAAAWPKRPASCPGGGGDGGNGGNSTGDTMTIGSPSFSRTFDLNSCVVVRGGVAATGTASGGYKLGFDSPGGPGGNLGVSGGGVNLDGSVSNITISVNGQFRASGTFQGGQAWTAVGTCSD
jgi:peptidoglycan hydrolase-like protein with peptidoglycan-binding domain